MALIVGFFFLLCVFAVTSKSVESVGASSRCRDLNLTPYVKRGKVSKARSLSAVDPALFAGVKSHAAYFTVNETQGWNTFFWFFPVDNKPLSSTPFLIWLNGGPGQSSLLGLFNEIGPLQIVNETVQKMPITWASDYSLLFIDNPVGTGFSYSASGNLAKNIDDVGRSLLNFIQQFLQVFPELRSAPLFITGESYAGKYIPAFGHYIHHNKNVKRPINLKGLAIGDGLIDAPNSLHNAEFGLQHGLLDFDGAKEVEEADATARKYWKDGDIEKYNEAFFKGSQILFSTSGLDYNNYMVDDPQDKSYVKFLNLQEVKKALHVARRLSFADDSDDVYRAFITSRDFFLTVKPWLEEMLEHYGVMCYSGQLDMVVAYSKSLHMYQNLTWSNSKSYRKAKRKAFTQEKPILYIKEGGNFVDVLVRKAGHMVPKDQPAYAKLMIDMFINKFKH